MIFESIEHALHYAAGNKFEVVIYGNKVVDVTEFKMKHPGGQDTIDKNIGKDITYAFDQVASHKTKTAMKDIDEFCIGTIKLGIDHKPILTEKEYSYKIDCTAGVLWQVWTKMNKAEYLDFIHDPKHMINPPEAVLFQTSFLEIFTKTPWYMIPILWGPLVIYLISQAYYTLDVPVIALVLLYLLGLFVWTFFEYALHRFIFHVDEKLPDNSFALMVHFLFHGIHHAFPMDK
jgi:4-hydroxysphinganine ceramide fatty acyl 2-hydroxylase